jgi:hypothetical protein
VWRTAPAATCGWPAAPHPFGAGWKTVVNGRVVVRAGQLATVNLGPLVERHNALALELVQKTL